MSLKQGETRSKGQEALKGTIVRYRLGAFASPHIGRLAYVNPNGEWVVRNSQSHALFVLAKDSEPVENRKASWSFSNKEAEADYIDKKGLIAETESWGGYPYAKATPKATPKYNAKPEDMLADAANQVIRDAKKKGANCD